MLHVCYACGWSQPLLTQPAVVAAAVLSAALLSSTAWLALAFERYVASAFCVQISRQAGTWAAIIEQYPWDVPIGGLWFILYALLWLFTRVVGVWIKSDAAMGLVLLDGVACSRCLTECGCEFKHAKDALQSTVTLLRASYWIAAILAATSACALKAMVQSGAASVAVRTGNVQRNAVGYSALPVVAPTAAEGGDCPNVVGPVQQNSVEVCLLTVHSSGAGSGQ